MLLSGFQAKKKALIAPKSAIFGIALSLAPRGCLTCRRSLSSFMLGMEVIVTSVIAVAEFYCYIGLNLLVAWFLFSLDEFFFVFVRVLSNDTTNFRLKKMPATAQDELLG